MMGNVQVICTSYIGDHSPPSSANIPYSLEKAAFHTPSGRKLLSEIQSTMIMFAGTDADRNPFTAWRKIA
jgi:hypothetical protein